MKTASIISLGLALVGSLLSGCGLQLDADPEIETNVCSSNSDCGSSGACVATQDGEARCVATSGNLDQVILEVRPTGSQASIPFENAVAFVGPFDGGALQIRDLVLPETVEVTGHVEAPASVADIDGCVGSDGYLPVDVTLNRPVDFSPFASRYEIPSLATTDAEAAFATKVPPGVYDVYLQPRLLEGCEAELPAPELRRGLVVEEGEPLDISSDEMAEVVALTGELIVPLNVEEAMLAGWVLEVLDPTYGYVISNQFALSAPSPNTSSLEIEGFFYHKTASPLLRLRDVDGSLSVHWSLDLIDLGANNDITIDLRDLVAQPFTYTASIVDSSGKELVSASVILQSTELTGGANQNANYRVETRTDAAGDITVSLVDGTYSVTIIPDVPGDATYFGDWVVKKPEESEQAFGQGKAFQLEVQPVMSGSVSDPLGAVLGSAPIAVGPSQLMTSDYMHRALLDPEPAKRQFSTTTSLDGTFALSVDPGEIDVAVQMPAETGYPWAVLPSFKVDEAELKPLLDVGEIQLRYPVIVQGKVSDAGAPVSYAQVRAWKRGGEAGDGPLIQIGSAITGADGGYVLPLPPGITFAETTPTGSPEGE